MPTKKKKKMKPIFISVNPDGLVDIVIRRGTQKIGVYRLKAGESTTIRLQESSGGGDPTPSPSRTP
jgi:hypothetical protein